MGFGSNLGAFASGFQATHSLKLMKKEKERNEKLAKEKEANAINWYTANKESLKGFQDQPQDVRNMLLYESVLYSDDWHKTLRDFEDAIQEGDLEEAKHINDMLEEQLKIEGDMLELGVKAENGFIGKYYTDESMEYVKKLRMGNLGNKPIGTKMYEESYGELPAETKAPAISDYTGVTNYLSRFINTSPEIFNNIKLGLQNKFPDIDMSNITQESLREPEKAVTGGGEKLRVTSLNTLEEYRQKALDANTWKEAESIIDDYKEAGYDPAPLEEKANEQEWINAKIDELDNHIEMLKEITDEKDKSIGDKKFKFLSGDEEETQTGEEWYKDIYEAYTFYLAELRKMGVDVSKYPKIKSPEEVKKVGILKGMFTGGGVERGYPSIYY